MRWRSWAVVSVIGLSFAVGLHAFAGDLKITLLKRSHITVVQRLNREGVSRRSASIATRRLKNRSTRHTLLDPDDPFTLNNLGYVAELQGQVDRAQSFMRWPQSSRLTP